MMAVLMSCESKQAQGMSNWLAACEDVEMRFFSRLWYVVDG